MLSQFPPYASSIHHDGSPRYVRAPRPDPALGEVVTLRLRAASEAPIERVLLRTAPDGEQHFVELQPLDLNPEEACRWWQTDLPLAMPLTSYRFLLFTVDGVLWYNASGLHRSLPTDSEDFRLLAGYQAPVWVRESVFYQIFPDRFADGDPSNNVRDGEFTYWGEPSRARRWGEPPALTGRGAMVEFYGGDLQGIRDRLEILQDLGVNALYLTPIFSALSNHRYDVIDYEAVDIHLGGEAALTALRQATEGRDMRLILDIVPNHCGVMHPWFQAALADPQSPTAEFFTFLEHPHDYACWLGVRGLPKLNYSSAALRQKMYAGPDSIFRRWMRPPYSIDGWRLDVANMLACQGATQLGREVGQGIRQAVKEENPHAYLLGENFFDASPQLQGDLWDASMNYSGFSKPLWYWLAGFSVHQHGQTAPFTSDVPWPAQAMVESWASYRAAIPWAIARQQFNQLGSHDTPRILNRLGGQPALNRLAAGILMTYPGVPCIYYGDEIGLDGEAGGTRACMPWDPSGWDQDLRAFYRTLAHLRRTSPALIEGGFQVLLVEADTLAYLRDADSEQILVTGHRGPGERPASLLPVARGAIADGTEFEELFSGRRARVEGGYFPLSAMSPGVQIWRSI